jgi:hypothetical protein
VVYQFLRSPSLLLHRKTVVHFRGRLKSP